MNLNSTKIPVSCKQFFNTSLFDFPLIINASWEAASEVQRLDIYSAENTFCNVYISSEATIMSQIKLQRPKLTHVKQYKFYFSIMAFY